MALARQYVHTALAIWEPRITVLEITVHDPFANDLDERAAEGALLIEIQFIIKTTGDQRSLVYPFYLIPGE
jgi:phage baseplate assembly protein W